MMRYKTVEMRKDSFAKRGRVYLTSKSYLSKVKRGCMVFILAGLVLSALSIFIMGLNAVSVILTAIIMLGSSSGCLYLIRHSRIASIKGDNLILKSYGDQSFVAPVESIHSIKSKDLLGIEFTSVHYNVDGHSDNFLILSNSLRKKSPGVILKEEVSNTRKRKKEANRKPGSVTTHMV